MQSYTGDNSVCSCFCSCVVDVNFYSATCTNIYGKVNTHLMLHDNWSFTQYQYSEYKFDLWLWPFPQLFDYSFLYSYRLYRYKYSKHRTHIGS